MADSSEPMTLLEAAKAGRTWIRVLCDELEIEPAETTINVKVDGQEFAALTLAKALDRIDGAIAQAEAA